MCKVSMWCSESSDVKVSQRTNLEDDTNLKSILNARKVASIHFLSKNQSILSFKSWNPMHIFLWDYSNIFTSNVSKDFLVVLGACSEYLEHLLNSEFYIASTFVIVRPHNPFRWLQKVNRSQLRGLETASLNPFIWDFLTIWVFVMIPNRRI